MKILSISMDDESLAQLNETQRKLGFKSRSKMMRNAIIGMMKGYEGLDSLRGSVDVIFVLTYNDSEKNRISDILHRFEGAIKSELHQHISGTCIDVLNINADAKEVQNIYGILQRNKSIRSATYVVVGKK